MTFIDSLLLSENLKIARHGICEFSQKLSYAIISKVSVYKFYFSQCKT